MLWLNNLLYRSGCDNWNDQNRSLGGARERKHVKLDPPSHFSISHYFDILVPFQMHDFGTWSFTQKLWHAQFQ